MLFEMKDLGESRVCLGLEISRDRQNRRLHLSQPKYMQAVLERFSMHESKPVLTPMESSFPSRAWRRSEELQHPAVDVPYRQAIGSVMFLMTGTRPDISFDVCSLAKCCKAPLEPHWNAVKRVLRYISGTRRDGLTFGSISTTDIIGSVSYTHLTLPTKA